MALPRLNDNPQYELKIPSSQQVVKFRPFLVKEQKVLLIAYESQDRKQILSAMLDTIGVCISEPIDVKKLSTFDVDYMFTMIRSKSVGETTDILIQCSDCDTQNEVKVKLDDIEVPVEKQEMLIPINDKMSVRMKYPNYDFFLNNDTLLDSTKTQSEIILSMIVGCLESIETEEERINLIDESEEEILGFLESLTTAQFDKISNFVLNIPAMEHDLAFKCVSCGKDNKRKLKGLEDFF